MKRETMPSSLDHIQNDPYFELREQRPDLFEPIPLRIGVSPEHPDGFPSGVVEGWRDIESPDFHEVEENGEPLINVANLKPPLFATNDYGAKMAQSGYETPLDGSTAAQYIRENVARQLLEAQSQLPENYRLVIFDGWRSLDTQYATYEMCYQSVLDKLVEASVITSDEVLTDEANAIISKETQKFISLPSPLPDDMNQSEADRARAQQIPSPHNTGGSIDLGIAEIDQDALARLEELESIASGEDDPFSPAKAMANFEISKLYREHATSLDFGTAFDFAGQQSSLTFCETDDSLGQTAKDSRRMLYNVMTRAGFEAYTEEWWHFNSGNQMAQMTQYRRTGEHQAAKYGNTNLSEAQRIHEQVHAQALDFLAHNADKEIQEASIPDELRARGATLDMARHLTSVVGDIRASEGFLESWDMKYRGELAPEFVQAVRQAQEPR